MNFGFLNFLFGTDDAATCTVEVPMTVINPSTGLPMVESGMGGVDVGGSPFGMDIHADINDWWTGTIDSSTWD